MEARQCLVAISFALAICTNAVSQTTYQANSENFVVFAPDRGLAQKASILAEQYRKELSIDWLGYEIETWNERCPVHIQIGPHAGGETSFAFVQGSTGKSEPISWQMKIYGPVDRLLDAVLPHEITHTIFATHFGQPLPRWADEGACTTVEHESEREKNHRMLLSFLTGSPSRGIPFNRMFTMKQYPQDILPLYAQGYSVARFLIAQKGRQHFIQYLEKGMSTEESNFDTGSWDQATSEYYGYQDLSDLQVNWIRWVRDGSPEQSPEIQVASAPTAPVEPSLIDPASSTYAVASNNRSQPNPLADSVGRGDTTPKKLNSWYARQSRAKQAVELPSNPAVVNDPFEEFKPGSLKRANVSAKNIDKLLKNNESKSNQTFWR